MLAGNIYRLCLLGGSQQVYFCLAAMSAASPSY